MPYKKGKVQEYKNKTAGPKGYTKKKKSKPKMTRGGSGR
jgi:hypothetical protein